VFSTELSSSQALICRAIFVVVDNFDNKMVLFIDLKKGLKNTFNTNVL